MDKKTNRNKSKKRPKRKGDTDPEKLNKSASDESPFDYGGLPERDLKKNLGCG